MVNLIPKNSRPTMQFLIVAVALGTAPLLAQEKSGHSLVPERGRRVTGDVDIIMDGKPQLKTAREILAIAQKTKFNDAGGYEAKHDGGSIQYVPPEPSRDAIRTALAEGLLLYKFTIKGAPPKQVNLSPGTYYFFMEYVDGRWIGVAVDQAATSRCFTFGLIAREVFTAHPGSDHVKGSRIVVHKIAPENDLATLGLQQAASDWADVQLEWVPFGAGCWKTIICVPGPSQ